MGEKRKKNRGEAADRFERDENGEYENEQRKKQKKQIENKGEILPSMIKNKEKRSEVHAKLKHQKKLDKRKKIKARDAAEKRALELGEEPPPKSVPRTIENTREFDETVCKPDDEELFAGNDADEFSGILKREHIPKVLITTCRFNSTRGPAFISELLSVIPNAHYYKRGTYDLKKIVEYANKKDFTSIIVVHTNRREPDALLIIGLPDGPTAHFKLSKLLLRKDIKNHGNPTSHKPELVLNNFTTRLGHRIGRLIQTLFPQDPNFRGRRVVTFHNQRDFIFFRHHRYIFESKESKQNDAQSKKAKDAKAEKASQEKVLARLQVFEFSPEAWRSLIKIVESRRVRRFVAMSLCGIRWLVAMVEAVFQAERQSEFIKYMRKGNRAFVAQRCSNVDVRFLNLTEYGGGRRGVLVIREGYEGLGWEEVVV